jgi:hypothetical protein
MAKFNYGINCDDREKAQKLKKFIENTNIFQDGLDVFEERVSVISNQHLIAEVEKFASKNEGVIHLEVWDIDLEFDEAEYNRKLQFFDFAGKVNSKITASPKIQKFKSYSGIKVNIENFKSWLTTLELRQFAIISEWHPTVEFGSHGIEFQCDDPKFDKVADKDWRSKGVVTEKLKN